MINATDIVSAVSFLSNLIEAARLRVTLCFETKSREMMVSEDCHLSLCPGTKHVYRGKIILLKKENRLMDASRKVQRLDLADH